MPPEPGIPSARLRGSESVAPSGGERREVVSGNRSRGDSARDAGGEGRSRGRGVRRDGSTGEGRECYNVVAGGDFLVEEGGLR